MVQQTRDMSAAWAGNRRRWDKVKTERAIEQLLALGWTRGPGGEMLPPVSEAVKTNA
jgi:hypothetical protein